MGGMVDVISRTRASQSVPWACGDTADNVKGSVLIGGQTVLWGHSR